MSQVGREWVGQGLPAGGSAWAKADKLGWVWGDKVTDPLRQQQCQKLKGWLISEATVIIETYLSDMPWQSLHSQHKPEEKRAKGEDERR